MGLYHNIITLYYILLMCTKCNHNHAVLSYWSTIEWNNRKNARLTTPRNIRLHCCSQHNGPLVRGAAVLNVHDTIPDSLRELSGDGVGVIGVQRHVVL